jgi:pilus assembly protein Flp/PilA
MKVNRFEIAQGFVEYGMILILVAMIVILVLSLLGAPVANVFSNVIHNL